MPQHPFPQVKNRVTGLAISSIVGGPSQFIGISHTLPSPTQFKIFEVEFFANKVISFSI